MPFSRSHHEAPTVGCPAKGSSMTGVKIRAWAVLAPLLRYVDENRFAVTQLGGYPLAIGGVHRAGVDDAKWISELAVRIGENAQHCHVDSHAPMLRRCVGVDQVALRSSVPMASSTATRVSADPEIAPSLMPVRSRLPREILVV